MLTFAIGLVIVVLTFTVCSNIFLLSERSEILNKLQKCRDRVQEFGYDISNKEFKADQKINAIVEFLKMNLVRPYSELTGQPYYKLIEKPTLSLYGVPPSKGGGKK